MLLRGGLVKWCMSHDLLIYTLPQKNATFELAGGIQSRDFTVTTSTQTSYDCARSMKNLEMESLASCYQEHSTNDVWYKIK